VYACCRRTAVRRWRMGESLVGVAALGVALVAVVEAPDADAEGPGGGAGVEVGGGGAADGPVGSDRRGAGATVGVAPVAMAMVGESSAGSAMTGLRSAVVDVANLMDVEVGAVRVRAGGSGTAAGSGLMGEGAGGMLGHSPVEPMVGGEIRADETCGDWLSTGTPPQDGVWDV
jgi:hypothetical protein